MPSPYTASQLQMMAKAIMALRNSMTEQPDPRYNRFIAALAYRTNLPQGTVVQKIQLMSEGDARGFQ